MFDIYARLSYSVFGEPIQVDDQIELCKERILARGARVGETFRDDSLSAWNPKVIRKDWLRLMARLASGASDGVMVYDLYRFSRKVREGEDLLELASQGVRVWALSGEYDLTTADGRKQFRDAISTAAAESDKNSERTKRGKVRRARKGRDNGGARAYAMAGWEPRPAGWEKGDPRTRTPGARVDAEREIVRECYGRLLGGEALWAVTRDLNERGRAGEPACLPVSGRLWGTNALSQSLRRPAVAGLLNFHGEAHGRLTGVEPIVSQAEWEQLCALFDARKTGRPPVDSHLLTNVIACERCGSPLRVWLRDRAHSYPDGTRRKEYRCPSPVGPGTSCGRNGIDGWVAEAAVSRAMVARLSDARRAGEMADYLARVDATRRELRAELERWQDNADALAGKTARWGVARVDAAMEPILVEIDRLTAELARLDEHDTGLAAADAVNDWHAAVGRGDVAARRGMVRRAFPRLTLALRARPGDHDPARLCWDGIPTPTTSDSSGIDGGTDGGTDGG